MKMLDPFKWAFACLGGGIVNACLDGLGQLCKKLRVLQKQFEWTTSKKGASLTKSLPGS